MTTGSRKPEDVLWEFSEELIQRRNPNVSEYQNYFKNPKKQTELMEDLIACKIAFLIAHPESNNKEDPESLNNLMAMLKSFKKKESLCIKKK